MKRQKQETILDSFSRFQKPLVKRAKAIGHKARPSATLGRDLHVIKPLDADKMARFDLEIDDDDASQEADVVPVQTSALALHDELFHLQTADMALHKTKDVKDSVHGLISFEPICWKIIDTLQFQRLRNLHQLGAASMVYIGATHSRFEHCLGVAHLAEKMVSSIRTSQPYLPITERDVLCIKIAGMCHDLGHGPFSHVFDGIYMKQLRRRKIVDPQFDWTHEQGSLDMFDHLLRTNKINVAQYGLENVDLVFIKELIYGGPLPGYHTLRGRTRPDQHFLYDFVNNATSGLDVDKLDYFLRDARHTKVKASCDVDILIRNARVLVDRDDPDRKFSICFPEKLAGQVMQAFKTRYELHQTVYQHKSVRAAEYMLCDTLLAADGHLKIKNHPISQIVHHIDAYQHLDDRVLARIEESDNDELRAARVIRDRMLTRSYYDFVGTTTVTSYSKKLTEERLLHEIINSSTPSRRGPVATTTTLTPNNLIVEFVRIHHGKGPDDPVQYVRFYAKASTRASTCYRLPRESYSMHQPQSFQDFSIRVFVKDKTLVARARKALTRWCKELNGSSVRPRNLDDD